MLIEVSLGIWGRSPIFNVFLDGKPNFRAIKKRKKYNSYEDIGIFLQYEEHVRNIRMFTQTLTLFLSDLQMSHEFSVLLKNSLALNFIF